MIFSNTTLQALRIRCLAAATYGRKLALADEYQASLEAEVGAVMPGRTQAHTILKLVENVIASRSGDAPMEPIEVQPQPIVASIEPEVLPEAVVVVDEPVAIESLPPPAVEEVPEEQKAEEILGAATEETEVPEEAVQEQEVEEVVQETEEVSAEVEEAPQAENDKPNQPRRSRRNRR